MILSSKIIKLNNYIFPYAGKNLSISENYCKNEVCAFVQKGIEKFVYLVDKKNQQISICNYLRQLLISDEF